MAKQCRYCGKEADDNVLQCSQCGNELPELARAEVAAVPPLLAPFDAGNPSDAATPTAPDTYQALTARPATLIFLGYFGAQLAVGIMAGVIGFAITGGPLGGDREQLQRITAMSALPIMVISGFVMLMMALTRIRPHLRDTTPTGAAWTVGKVKENAFGVVAGVLTAIGYAFLINLFPPPDEMARGPLTRMAITPGAQQLVWVVVAILLAPIIEECLFRGILYGGYRRSFGHTRATMLSTFIFWALHLTETAQFWPAMVAIATLALVALWFRLKFSAIGPAVAVHIGYNGFMVLGAIAYTLSGAAE
jgi:membrane protease YdiL (CAAX protease family)